MSKQHHYITGAGQAGCLYDYGPNAVPGKRAAIADCAWYMEGIEECTPADVRRARSDLHKHGIHWFPDHLRPSLGMYFEISKEAGPMPESED